MPWPAQVWGNIKAYSKFIPCTPCTLLYAKPNSPAAPSAFRYATAKEMEEAGMEVKARRCQGPVVVTFLEQGGMEKEYPSVSEVSKETGVPIYTIREKARSNKSFGDLYMFRYKCKYKDEPAEHKRKRGAPAANNSAPATQPSGAASAMCELKELANVLKEGYFNIDEFVEKKEEGGGDLLFGQMAGV